MPNDENLKNIQKKKSKSIFDLNRNKIVKNSLISKNGKEIIKKIYSSQSYHIFFSKMRKSSYHQKLFFLHKNDLFGISTEMKLPYFFLFRISKKKIKGLQYLVSRELNITRDRENLLGSWLENSNLDVKKFLEGIVDIIIYFLIYFIRSNKKFKNLVNTKEFNYKIMKTILKGYENIKIDDFLNELEIIFKEEEGKIDPTIAHKIRDFAHLITIVTMKNIENLIDFSKMAIPNIILPFHQLSKEWLLNILKKANLKEDEYLDILDDLYMNNLINNESIIFWCEACSLESPSYSEFHGRIGPSNIIKTKCQKCGKSQSYSCIFSLDDLIKDAIFSKDGFLSIYFGWLLKKENVSFTTNEYSSEYEFDFIINNNILVECKMFKREKDQEAIKSELDNAIIQIINHLKSINKLNKNITKAYLLWNRYEDINTLIKIFKTKYRNLFINYRFEVFGPKNIEKLVSRLKES